MEPQQQQQQQQRQQQQDQRNSSSTAAAAAAAGGGSGGSLLPAIISPSILAADFANLAQEVTSTQVGSAKRNAPCKHAGESPLILTGSTSKQYTVECCKEQCFFSAALHTC
jgi:hypothetical protein